MVKYKLDAIDGPLRAALERMQLCPEDERPFVIVTDTITGRFVQFCGSRARKLTVDLPKSSEGPNRYVDENLCDIYLQTKQRLSHTLVAYNSICESAEDAVSLAKNLMDKVHHLPEFAEVTIEEGRNKDRPS